jgi:hypothetical protein
MLKLKVSYIIYHVLGGHWHHKSEPPSPADYAAAGGSSYDSKGTLPAIRYSLIPSNKKSETVRRKRFNSLPHSPAEKRPTIWDYK